MLPVRVYCPDVPGGPAGRLSPGRLLCYFAITMSRRWLRRRLTQLSELDDSVPGSELASLPVIGPDTGIKSLCTVARARRIQLEVAVI